MTILEATSTQSLEQARARLVSHALYQQLTSLERVRVFMQHHVFAVWDFFSLLKRLQCEVTCVTVPWRPRGLGDHARFITEIVMAEECDEGVDGGHLSHYELYLSAMDELGADRAPIDGLVRRVATGENPFAAIRTADIPPTASAFVQHTLQLATKGSAHEVASSFCHGRENLLPDVLGGVRDGMSEVLRRAPVFLHYLERHITLDHDEHGPLALELLAELCDGDAQRLQEADRVAVAAVEARSRLWDGVLEEFERKGI